MLHLGKAQPGAQVHRCAIGLVLLALLTGCATDSGPPLGGMMMFNAMRYRPATPLDAPDTAAAKKKARQEREALARALIQGCRPRDGEMSPISPAARLAPSPRIVLALHSGSTEGGEPFGQATQGYNVPGRNPESQMPWEFFLGNAAHRLIAYMYGVNYPQSRAYYNTKALVDIIAETGLGDESRLLPHERNLRPDITDISRWRVFEIKPWNDKGLQEGHQAVQIYLVALNRTVLRGGRFSGGTGFHGEVLIRFAQGQYIWRLEWKTTEPGLVQYRWTRSQQRYDLERVAHEAGQWVDITDQEMRQYGGWVGQAVEGMVSRREQLATFSGAVGVCIDIIGGVAVGIFSSALSGRPEAKHSSMQPPTQGGGQVIPFPPRPPVSASPAQIPAAASGR